MPKDLRYLKLNKELRDYLKENMPNSYLFYQEPIDDNFYNIVVYFDKSINWAKSKIQSSDDNKEKELLTKFLNEFKNQKTEEEDNSTENSTESKFWLYPVLQISFIFITIFLILLDALNSRPGEAATHGFLMWFIIGAVLFFDFIICGISAIFSRNKFFLYNLVAGSCLLFSLPIIFLIFSLIFE